MGLFSRKPRRPQEPAPEGNGEAPVTATFPRGDDAEVAVGGIRHRWEVARSLAGNRPRGDDDYPEREKGIKVRLVREPDNEYDPNAIAVWSDKHGHVGYVNRKAAAEIAPIIDRMRVVAGKSLKGEALDVYCSADLYATWDEWDPDPEYRDPDADKNEPDDVEITLCFRLPLDASVKRRADA